MKFSKECIGKKVIWYSTDSKENYEAIIDAIFKMNNRRLAWIKIEVNKYPNGIALLDEKQYRKNEYIYFCVAFKDLAFK